MSGIGGLGKPLNDKPKNPDDEKIIDGATGEAREKGANHDELDAAIAANEPAPAEFTEYSCHPIQNFHMGRFHFEKGILRLKGADVEEFESLLSQQPVRDQNRIQKLADEKSRAEALARSFMQTKRVRGVDTSTTGNPDKPAQ